MLLNFKFWYQSSWVSAGEKWSNLNQVDRTKYQRKFVYFFSKGMLGGRKWVRRKRVVQIFLFLTPPNPVRNEEITLTY